MPPIEITKADYDAGRIGADFAHPPCAAHLNARFESHDPAAGVLRISFMPRPEFANPGGTVQGGFIAATLFNEAGDVLAKATQTARLVDTPKG